MVQGLHHKRHQRTIIFQTETPAVSSVIRSAEGICVADHHETFVVNLHHRLQAKY